MTLKEAVQQNLTKYPGCLVPIEEVCRRNEQQNLFRKGDGTYPDPSWIFWGVKNYLDKFEVFVRLRR